MMDHQNTFAACREDHPPPRERARVRERPGCAVLSRSLLNFDHCETWGSRSIVSRAHDIRPPFPVCVASLANKHGERSLRRGGYTFRVFGKSGENPDD